MSNILSGVPALSSVNQLIIDGHSFTFEEFSEGNEIYIFINGWCSIRYFWTPYFNDFSPLGKCITLDVLGHFPSIAGSNFNELGFEDYIHIQAKAIQALAENKKVNLIGHSTGGMFALAIGALYPNLIKKVVSITPAVYGPLIGILHFAKVMTDLKLDVSLELFFTFIKNFPSLFHKWFEEAAYNGNEFVNREDVREFILNYHSHFIKLDPYIMGRYLQVLHNSDLRPLMIDSNLEALVIGASHDPIVPVTQHREVSSLLKNGKYYEVIPSGHIPTLEKREETIGVILNFLKL
jgi:pimeloyl-ACP methyl ester carboxylesterase